MNRLKNITNKVLVKGLFGLIMPIAIMLAPVSASALSLGTSKYFGTQAGQAACTALSGLQQSDQNCKTGSTTVNGLIKTIINILTVVVGVISVIMIIVSGLRFVTSAGDTSKIASARSGLIYALIGLALVAIAQSVVHFALDTAVDSSS